ncbi:MAG: hypothetical protein NTZ28_00740 [Nitrospirae bacterium]|nr:hypothetical protein [Nitrospirota bacterium]
MTWKNLIIILLLLPTIWWWYVLPPSTAEFAKHMVLSPEGSHCNEICVHPSSLIDPPQESATFEIPDDESAPHEQLIALLPHPHASRDRPPPLFWSTSHSLRAPPTLILA